jgi:hypothetical protein
MLTNGSCPHSTAHEKLTNASESHSIVVDKPPDSSVAQRAELAEVPGTRPTPVGFDHFVRAVPRAESLIHVSIYCRERDRHERRAAVA